MPEELKTFGGKLDNLTNQRQDMTVAEGWEGEAQNQPQPMLIAVCGCLVGRLILALQEMMTLIGQANDLP